MMATVCEPLRDGVLLVNRIQELKPKTILLVFWHGIGDLVMFVNIYRRLQDLSPDIEFTIGLPGGLSHEEMLTSRDRYVLVSGEEVNDHPELLPFDLVAKITFPMSEGQEALTKGEWCCKHEIGIEPICGHGILGAGVNRLVAVHFQITCLPDACNPDRDTAERVWNDILEAGWIPLETHFQHIFHNPVNEKFDFVDASVRRARPRVSSLVGLLRNCSAFVGVVSGNFHVALSVLPPGRVFLLEKHFTAPMFTKHNIARANLLDYKGEVKGWLQSL